MSYSIELDKEIKIGETIYSVFLEADLTYSHSEDPECTEVQITKANIRPLDGHDLPIEYDGVYIEKVIVKGHPELTEAIEKALWDAIQINTEDNYQSLKWDLEDDEA